MCNLKLVPKKPKPTAEQLKEMLKDRARTIDGEQWISIRDLNAAIRLIMGDEQ
ncbi:hypothetical protein SAMN05216189_104717 [Pseudomonas delhiensis]|uniref:Uncharacterized protein n=1 Tax=Pseudomonas delhiensis TaxID=366289 RepID=A0A239NET4_9PSED|nr:hypothetical protein [Pseudomonas delhiensis]SDK68093.1 hypothetical protein SAMN05216189_104717 [Pseudomonas delhiensis]SNT52639.1 hypothetical protein SAMN06295949_14217 [Pseudomonas delhiensis]